MSINTYQFTEYKASELMACSHSYELVPSDKLTVRIDYKN